LIFKIENMRKQFHLLAALICSSALSLHAWNTPTVNSPANNSNGWVGQTFDWSAVASSAGYQIEIDTVNTFSSPVRQRVTNAYINSSSSNTDTDESFGNLYFGKNYYWRVRAYITNDTSAWSATWLFQTRNYVTMTSPATASSQWSGLTLDWATHVGVSFYDMQCDTTPLFNSGALRTSTDAYINSSSSNTDTDEYLTGLYFGKTYYWRVRARNAVSTSAWSTPWTFVTRDYVTMTSPATASSQWTGLTLDWATHVGVSFYDMQCDTTPLFNSGALRTSTDAYINSSSSNTDTDEYLSGLYFGKTYYWRVRARNAVDTTVWSTPWTFVTRDYVTLTSPATASSQWTGLTLDWATHVGVSFYDMQCDTTPLFNSGALRTSTDAYINSSSSNTDTDEYLSGLYFGKTYYWRVRARNAVDTTAWTTPWTFVTRDYVTLTSPATASSQWTGLTLDWATHVGVSFYDMQCDTTPLFNSGALRSSTDAYINSVSSNIDTDEYLSGLYFGKTYYWRVRARNAVDTTAWTTPWTFVTRDYVTLTSPATASSQWTGLTLDWSTHVGVSFYDMQCDTTPLFNSPALRSSTDAYINSVSSNIDTDEYLSGLYFGKTYYWRVRARNAVDTTAWTTPWTFVTRDYVSLNTPANAQLNVNPAGVTLDWLAHTGVGSYQVQWDSINTYTSPVFQQATTAYINSVSSNTDTQRGSGALASNRVYFWRVRAWNAVDTSEWTERWFSTGTVQPVIPGVPVHVAPANNATSQPLSVLLDWNTSANAQSYDYQYATNPSFTGAITANTTASSATISGLSQSTYYYWRVRGVNGNIVSAWSTYWKFTTTGPLSAPLLISPANTSSNIALSGVSLVWNSVPNATQYEYQYSTDPTFVTGVQSGTSAITSASTGSLSSLTTYYWRIRATDGVSFSPWSASWSFQTELLLAAPSLISPANFTTGVTVGGVQLTWNTVANALQYEYAYSTDPSFASNVVSGLVTPTNTTTGALNTYTTYYWHIRAVNGSVYSPWSATWSFETALQLVAPALVSPADLSTNIPQGGTLLTWNSIANATGYEYEYTTDPSFASGVTSGATGSLSVSTATLQNQATYYWRVRGYNGSVFSPWSTVWSFTTDLQLVAPVLVSPADLSTGIVLTGTTLTWNTIANATAYEYEFSIDPSFATGVVSGTIGTTSVATGSLANATTYYWRVRGTNGNVFSPWSVVWSFTTDNTLGINSMVMNGLQVFPVPTNAVLTIRSNAGTTGIRLFDLAGNCVYTFACNNAAELQLDVTPFAAGTYLLEVNSSAGSSRTRIVIAH
jgi:hypothetical protein